MTKKREVKFDGLEFKNAIFKQKDEDEVEVSIKFMARRLPTDEIALNGISVDSPVKSVELSLSRVDRIVLESKAWPQQELDFEDKKKKEAANKEKVKKHTRPATAKEKAETKKNAKKAAENKKPAKKTTLKKGGK